MQSGKCNGLFLGLGVVWGVSSFAAILGETVGLSEGLVTSYTGCRNHMEIKQKSKQELKKLTTPTIFVFVRFLFHQEPFTSY